MLSMVLMCVVTWTRHLKYIFFLYQCILLLRDKFLLWNCKQFSISLGYLLWSWCVNWLEIELLCKACVGEGQSSDRDVTELIWNILIGWKCGIRSPYSTSLPVHPECIKLILVQRILHSTLTTCTTIIRFIFMTSLKVARRASRKL